MFQFLAYWNPQELIPEISFIRFWCEVSATYFGILDGVKISVARFHPNLLDRVAVFWERVILDSVWTGTRVYGTFRCFVVGHKIPMAFHCSSYRIAILTQFNFSQGGSLAKIYKVIYDLKLKNNVCYTSRNDEDLFFLVEFGMNFFKKRLVILNQPQIFPIPSRLLPSTDPQGADRFYARAEHSSARRHLYLSFVVCVLYFIFCLLSSCFSRSLGFL